MSWIQENKFVAGLAGATAVIGGAILFFGISQGNAYNETLLKFEELKGQYRNLEKAKPYPTAENLSEREDGIADYETSIKEVRELVMGYRPEKLEKMTPEQFKDIQVKMNADLHKACMAAGTEMPEDCLFGFEKYSTGSVKSGATAKLNYELGAIHWLLKKLADAKPEAISNIRRCELPEESGQVATTPRTGQRGPNQKRIEGRAAGRAYELMPMELSFTASESAVREFLVSMVNSKEYYYSIRGIRIRNEKQLPPNEKDADFPVEKTEAADDGFGSFEDEEMIDGGADGGEAAGEGPDEESADEGGESVDPAPATAPETKTFAPGELVLKQVLGSEKLHVQIAFDIVLIEKKKEQAKPQRGRRQKRQ